MLVGVDLVSRLTRSMQQSRSLLCLGSCLGRSGKFKIPVYTTYRGQTCLELGCTLKGVLLNLVAFNLGSVRRFVISLGV